MAEERAGQSGFAGLDPVIKTIAEWARLCRIALGSRNELAVASPEEVAAIARELGVRPPDLAGAITGWPHDAALLREMMAALGIDPDAQALRDEGTLAELQRTCSGCGEKADCTRDLAQGTAAENFYGYCPNARRLDTIYVETTFNQL
jgi:hypothetical protein